MLRIRFAEALAIGREWRHRDATRSTRMTMLERLALCLRVEACRHAGRGNEREALALFAEEESVLRQRIAIQASWWMRHSLLRSLLDQKKPSAELLDCVRSLDPVVAGRVRLNRQQKHAICMAAGVGNALIGEMDRCRSSLDAAARIVRQEGAVPDPSFLWHLSQYGLHERADVIEVFRYSCNGLSFQTALEFLAGLGIFPSDPAVEQSGS